MQHKDAESQIQERADKDTAEMSCGVLRDQYAGDSGYNPGSQMVQIVGISLLDPVDHYVKEKLHVKRYIRYMDDFWALVETKECAEELLTNITVKLKEYGLEVNKKKSHIIPLNEGFVFLGFQYRLTETGKIIMTLDPDSVKHERKTLARMESKVRKGELKPEKVDEHHESWENNASKGNSYKMLKRTKQYLKQLRKGERNENKKNDADSGRSSRG